MPYVPFNKFCPEVAKRETRSVTVLEGSNTGVPPDKYGFFEMFCDEKGCDCRRVFLYVVSAASNHVQAVIAYGWESPEFYGRWMGDNDPDVIEALSGPCLNLGSPESDAAPAILELFREVLLQDAVYVDRIKRHYRMFREHVDGVGNRRRHSHAKNRKRPKA